MGYILNQKRNDVGQIIALFLRKKKLEKEQNSKTENWGLNTEIYVWALITTLGKEGIYIVEIFLLIEEVWSNSEFCQHICYFNILFYIFLQQFIYQDIKHNHHFVSSESFSTLPIR